MNLFEHLFGFSPDRGSGSLELAVLLCAIGAFLILSMRFIRRPRAALK